MKNYALLRVYMATVKVLHKFLKFYYRLYKNKTFPCFSWPVMIRPHLDSNFKTYRVRKNGHLKIHVNCVMCIKLSFKGAHIDKNVMHIMFSLLFSLPVHP